ncbi:hypothetical protein Pan97_24960 [Bremerella volcania]|uniref:Uncharacterized protein n=1 Tax=Bremerella volcania TaxID=2527984 RepID=A0A518C8D2_9BACT|nr:hypothetical protein [Bremerella volcania]QDU75464.1 hypothetical protein Pan97_24960 [Bremerella volcania]
MIQLLIIGVAIYVVVQGVRNLNKASAPDAPANTKRDGIIFTVVGGLLLLLGLSFGFLINLI